MAYPLVVGLIALLCAILFSKLKLRGQDDKESQKRR